MGPRWVQIEVILQEGRGEALTPPPGRVMLAGGTHTFAELARAIDVAFARWDHGHLHLFELSDGRLVGPVDEDDEGWTDETRLLIADELKPDAPFTYVFDLGDEWRHACRVTSELADPRAEVGEVPARPVPIWGWGAIPDQHGRIQPDDEPGD